MNVYDFDNTIYDGESAFHLFRFFMKKDKGLITFLPAVVTAFTKYKLGKLSVEEAINKYADDLILSCSPEISLSEICQRLDIKNFIGTSINEEEGKIERLCLRENKVKAFFEKYPNAEIDDLYTDSFNDKPLMDISKHVYLVKGYKIKKIK